MNKLNRKRTNRAKKKKEAKNMNARSAWIGR